MRGVTTRAGALFFATGAALGPQAAERDAATERAGRIERTRRELLAEIGAIEAFGRAEPFRAALERLEEAHGEIEIGKERWAPVARGWLPMNSVDRWLAWNQPAPGRELQVALDTELPNHPFPTIVDLSRQLIDPGVAFLLAVVPRRAQIEPELADAASLEGSEAPFRGMVGATTAFLERLAQQGVEVVNLAPHFVDERFAEVPAGLLVAEPVAGGDAGDAGDDAAGAERKAPDWSLELYLKRNKHWTPRGVELAARVLAQRVREQPWFEPGPCVEGVDFHVKARFVDFASSSAGQAPDLTRERLPMNVVRDVGAGVNPADARRSPIVLLSDSFAKFHREQGAGLADQLRRFTGWPIDMITPLGGAELQRRDALARRRDDLRGKKVVIWLLQEENLRPLPEFRPIELFAAGEDGKREKSGR
jgi:hypothetical protein